MIRVRGVLGVVLLAAWTVACQAHGEVKTVDLEPMSDSGVSGSVTLTEIGSARTQVVVSVDPAGHADMPAHIHPGSCDDLVPQPRYALANVMNGQSVTEVPASLDELLAGDVAVNLHKSNAELDVYTACAVLR